jgi:hypothetical protein
MDYVNPIHVHPDRDANFFFLYIHSELCFFPSQYWNPGPNRNLTLGPNPNPDPNYKPNPNPNTTINPLLTSSFYFLRNGWLGKKKLATWKVGTSKKTDDSKNRPTIHTTREKKNQTFQCGRFSMNMTCRRVLSL